MQDLSCDLGLLVRLCMPSVILTNIGKHSLSGLFFIISFKDFCYLTKLNIYVFIEPNSRHLGSTRHRNILISEFPAKYKGWLAQEDFIRDHYPPSNFASPLNSEVQSQWPQEA